MLGALGLGAWGTRARTARLARGGKNMLLCQKWSNYALELRSGQIMRSNKRWSNPPPRNKNRLPDYAADHLQQALLLPSARAATQAGLYHRDPSWERLPWPGLAMRRPVPATRTRYALFKDSRAKYSCNEPTTSTAPALPSTIVHTQCYAESRIAHATDTETANTSTGM